MSGILSQDEINALLKNFPGGEIETGTDKSEESSTFELYDLTKQESVVRHPMPALDIICEKFSKNYRTNLSTLLRKVVDVTTSSQEIIKFRDFINTLHMPTSLHIFKMNSLNGSGLLTFQSDLIFTVIDILFGGKGSKIKMEGREFTPIEIRVINRLRDAALKDFEESWSSIYKINCRVMRSELNPQFAGIAFQDDLVQVIVFEVQIEEVTGSLTICLPYSMLEPIKERLMPGFRNEEETGTRWKQGWQQILMDAPVNIVAELGSAFLTCQELLNLSEGDVLVIDKSTDDPLEMKVEGVTKFKGYPGTYKDCMAIQIASSV